MQCTVPSTSSNRATELSGGSSKPNSEMTPSTSTARIGRLTRDGPLPAVVGERFVRLGHAVDVVLPLPSAALLLGRVEDLAGEALCHRVLATRARVLDEPADRERAGASRRDL